MNTETTTNIPPALQSSIDPTQISLTIESTGKAVAGVVVFLAMLWGADPNVVQTNWAQTIALVATAAPAAYALWHSAAGLWGMARKVLVAITTPKTI